jgi:hypothetical protein
MEEQEIYLLRQASIEIKRLRQQNQIMSARLEMFDQLMLLFHTQPNYPSQGMSPDIVYDIDKLLQSKEPQ